MKNKTMKKGIALIALFVSVTLSLVAQTNMISIQQDYAVYDEAVDTMLIPVRIFRTDANASSVQVQIVDGFEGAVSNEDFVLLTNSIDFVPTGSDTQYIKIEIINDTLVERAEYFAVEIFSPQNAGIANAFTTLYIQDNDYVAPTPRRNIELAHLGSFNILPGGSSAEIVAFDSASNKLFVVNSLKTKLHILDFDNPASLSEVGVIDMSIYGSGITSVASQNGMVAVTVVAPISTDNGCVIFLDTDGTFVDSISTGSLPDMVTFTPDGKYVLVANEGQPNDLYTIDPEGSVTVIDIQNGVLNAVATTADFSAFNGQEPILRQQGVRIFGANDPSVAQDVEPEYIAVSAQSDTAWITLQENNSIAVLDIATKTIIEILPLHSIDHSLSGNGLDISDVNEEILIANWPVKGLYLPDAIAAYTVNDQKYLITANEGDAREYDGLEEEKRIGSGSYVLDAAEFPQADLLKRPYNLGRLNALTSLGDTDNDGDFDSIFVLGGRGFSIWNSTGVLQYNSGDDFEQIIKADTVFSNLFNANNEEDNTPKNRSDNKGPEPEGVAVGNINDTMYAFIGLERMGGVMVYDVTVPAQPVFVQYINTRDTMMLNGDNGTEGIIFLHADKNKAGKHFVITANETSSTIGVFEVLVRKEQEPPASVDALGNLGKLNIYPNPNNGNRLYFSQPISGSIYDISGKLIQAFSLSNSIQLHHLAKGIYFIKVVGFRTQQIVVN